MIMGPGRIVFAIALVLPSGPVSTPASAQEIPLVEPQGENVLIRFNDVQLGAALRAMSRYLDRPLLFTGLDDVRVSLETPEGVPRPTLPTLLRALVEGQGYELVVDSAFYQVVGTPSASGTAEDDRPAAQALPELFVLKLRHARAEDVAATVNALFGRAVAFGEFGEPLPTLSDELRASLGNEPPTEEVANRPDAAVQGGQQAVLTGELTVVPDLRTNSLLVRANVRDFGLIEAVIQEIDLRPIQVLTEVLIVEVRRDRGLSFGTGLELPATRVSGSTDTEVGFESTGLGLADFVLRLMGAGGVDLNATLTAAASRGDVSIVSRPVVITANNESAQILVGSQRPFVQVQRTLPTDQGARDQVVQYRDVGTELTVRPTVSGDGYVMLEILQEVNAATAETAFDAPIISTRTVQTQLLVRDGQTAVLGGLTDSQREHTQSGIPILSSIPWIGGLFGGVTDRTRDTELFVFLTPRIIADDEALDAATESARSRSGGGDAPSGPE